MPSRNAGIIDQIVESLEHPVSSEEEARERLEHVFVDRLLIVACNVESIARYAEELRLAVSPEECVVVLNCIGRYVQCGVSIEQVEEVINTLYPDRFVEP